VDGDFLRSVAEAVLQLLMETDVEGLIGAGRYERSGVRPGGTITATGCWTPGWARCSCASRSCAGQLLPAVPGGPEGVGEGVDRGEGNAVAFAGCGTRCPMWRRPARAWWQPRCARRSSSRIRGRSTITRASIAPDDPANLNSTGADAPMNAFATSRIYTSLTGTAFWSCRSRWSRCIGETHGRSRTPP
jgi:hypothetical protein